MENNLFFASDLLDSADDIHQQDQFGAVEHKTDSHQSKYSVTPKHNTQNIITSTIS